MDTNSSALKPIDTPERLHSVLDAVAELGPEGDALGEVLSALKALPAETHFNGIDASADGVFESESEPDKFQAVGTIYVQLKFGGAKEGSGLSESYPAYIFGHFVKDKAVIDTVTVDTTSFEQ